jgi:CheY-like chemotaxis protein
VTKILLVEDNTLLGEMMVERLEYIDFEVILVEDGAQAITMAKSQPIDIILMDMSLPVMSGWDATVQIKADKETCHIPIIALTAHAITGERDKALQVGCDEYITKPVDFPYLVNKIHQIVGSAK